MTPNFTPYNQEEASNLLTELPEALLKHLNKFKVTQWLDANKRELLYGIQGRYNKSTWYNLQSNNRALIFDDKKLANKVCRKFNQLTSVN